MIVAACAYCNERLNFISGKVLARRVILNQFFLVCFSVSFLKTFVEVLKIDKPPNYLDVKMSSLEDTFTQKRIENRSGDRAILSTRDPCFLRC